MEQLSLFAGHPRPGWLVAFEKRLICKFYVAHGVFQSHIDLGLCVFDDRRIKTVYIGDFDVHKTIPTSC